MHNPPRITFSVFCRLFINDAIHQTCQKPVKNLCGWPQLGTPDCNRRNLIREITAFQKPALLLAGSRSIDFIFKLSSIDNDIKDMKMAKRTLYLILKS